MGFGSTTGFGNRPKYTLTSAPEGTSTVYFQSISAMPAYNTKSFEELRFEDYSSGRVNQMGKTFGTPQTLGFDRHLPTQTTGLGFDANQEKKKEMERKFEEEKRNLEAEKKKLEDEKRKLVEEKIMKAKKKLEEEKTKLEEGRKKLEEEKRKKIEEDMKKLEEERRMVEEEKKKIERERKNLELQSIFHFQKN